MQAEYKFLNDVIKPWDELNSLLKERYAVQPDLSTITSFVSSISNSIKHQVDIHALNIGVKPKILQKEVDTESQSSKLISDVSDSSKHIQLKDPARENKTTVAATFEINTEGNFRFIRNEININHATLGNNDFMVASLEAIKYWIKKQSLNIQWTKKVLEAENEFFHTAFLYFNPKYCINMASTQFKIFKRNELGILEPFSPEELRFEIYEFQG